MARRAVALAPSGMLVSTTAAAAVLVLAVLAQSGAAGASEVQARRQQGIGLLHDAMESRCAQQFHCPCMKSHSDCNHYCPRVWVLTA